MDPSDIKVEVRSGVAALILAAPDRRNALTVEMATALIEACDRLDADGAVGSIVVRGEGPAFCSGADRALLAAAAERSAGAREALALIYRSFGRVRDLRVPSIAAVRGHAVGAGLNLAL